MSASHERTSCDRPGDGQEDNRGSWWLEDPFGSMITGLVAPTAAVAMLATGILGLAWIH